ncbi:MAG: co-chaperone GroES [Planctomycetes bacterium]|nr:co-chaperone GroES [Planctomycetota bacterium]
MSSRTETTKKNEKIVDLKIRPLSDRVIIRPEEPVERSAGGIYLPDTAKEKPARGKVIAVGAGRLVEKTGERLPLAIKVGDQVLYGKYSGSEVKVNGIEYTIVKEQEILGVLE